jgi:enoyl-[acyl-carrier-protein] reductase (NADH)
LLTRAGELAGKIAMVTAVITEDAIGAARARVLCESGAHIVLADLNDGDLERTTASLVADSDEFANTVLHF